MKNLLKDKKVIIGGIAVLGLIAFYYNRGRKVLANQTPNSYSNAVGDLTSSATLTNFSWGGLGATSAPINANNSPIASERMETIISNGSKESILQQSLAQFQANSQSNSAISTPIITNSGIKVLPNGILEPIGLKGVVTTFQAGLLGAVPKESVKEIEFEVENKIKNQTK